MSSHALRQLKAVRMNLLECVSGFRSRKATDPRDKIYGLMELGVEEGTELIRPDYTLPVETAYEDFAISLLHRMQNLDILSHVRNEQSHGFNLVLPTFVPDWTIDLGDVDSREIESRSMRFSTLDLYDAAQNTMPDYEAHLGVLCIRGAIVDTVKTITNRTMDDSTDGATVLKARDFLDEAMRIANIPPRNEDPGLVKREPFWLTMTAGAEPEPTVPPSDFADVQPLQRASDAWTRVDELEADFYESFENLTRTFNPSTFFGNLLPRDFYLFDHAISVAQRGRKFMVTELEWMGLVPRHTTEGDVVAVLTGGRVPLILRASEDFFTVVGDAYVHGIMDGEAVEYIDEPEWIELH